MKNLELLDEYETSGGRERKLQAVERVTNRRGTTTIQSASRHRPMRC